MKRLLKSKCGMSLMEILVALSLLMIVIVGTTPVMLQAYDGLYTAGEYTQNVYNAKTEVEDQLATRSSTINYKGFKVNFEGLGEVARVNAKRAVSSLKNSLETLFTGAKVRIYISSGSEVDDNQSNHSITLQTVNLEFASKNDIVCDKDGSEPEELSPEGKRIKISAYLPKKDAVANTAAAVYGEKKADVTIVDDTTIPAAGRIGINISSSKYPIDFTTSPIKIVVTYLDENDNEKKVHTYLTIKTPTIMLVGETNENVQYYTSAGVVETKDSNGNVIKRQLEFEGRRMNIGYDTKTGARSDKLGAASTQAIPAGTVFKSVNWITEYARTTGGSGAGSENIEYANTCYEPEYYVLTGTNGAIYRTYTFTDPNSIKGKVDLNTAAADSNPGINGLYLNSLTTKNQKNKDVMGIRDTEIYLDDRASTVVYPAVWGGDFSHVFGWSSYENEMGYISRLSVNNDRPSSADTWQTEDDNKPGTGLPGFYSNLASFGYYYNGWGTKDEGFHTINSRKISYVLTEVEYAIRIGGLLNGVGSSSKGTYGYDGAGFDRIWERPLSLDLNTSWQTTYNNWKKDESYWFTAKNKYDDGETQTAEKTALYNENNNLMRCIMLDPDGSSKKYYDVQTHVPVYIMRESDSRPDNGMAQLRLKALTTLSSDFLYTRLDVSPKDNEDERSDVNFVYNKTANESKIIVTDAVYIPATSTTEAQVFYTGTVAAYGVVNQVDNVGTSDTDPDVNRIHDGETASTGRLSTYWIVSNDDGSKTEIYKHSTKSDSPDIAHGTIRERLMNSASSPTTNLTANDKEGKSAEFFVSIPVETVSSRVFTDVSFTLGYTSNREMVYTNIVYGSDSNGKLIQSLKFCEPYYFQSHYGDANKTPNLYMNEAVDKLFDNDIDTLSYRNVAENDYYNVWFPGEMYNLTKIATKDNVTVAVGYAVAGSSYTYLNSKINGGTALGGIYNDGVIAGMVLGKDSAFKHMLYFKDNITFDDDSLYNADTNPNYTYKRYGKNDTTGANINAYKSLGWNYGTHARDSVQFTCVDISVVQSGDTSYYYAYYADNKGRVFRSLVATRGKNDAAATMVDYISDKSTSPGIEDVSYMEEQTILHNGKTEKIGYFFESIKSINSYDDVIIITGHSRGVDETDGTLKVAVGVIDKADPTKAPEWKIVKWLWANYVVYDTLIQDGYVYLVGENIHTGTAFVFAITLDKLRSEDHYTELDYDNTGEKDVIFWENYYTSNKVALYAIAGKGGN